MEINYHHQLSMWNRVMYFILERIPFFTKKYVCEGCETDYTVRGAKKNMIYYCNESSCKGKLEGLEDA